MAPVYKIKLRSSVEKPTSRLNQYLKAIKKGKQLPKSQCSVVVFKPHENRLATLLTRYLNRIGTLSAQRCEKYKKSILQRVQSKNKRHEKKKPKVNDGVVKATKIQKGNTHVMKWTDNCMKQFLSQKMSKDVMLWRPRSPDRSHVQLHVPKGKLPGSSSSTTRKKRVPQVTSVPTFTYPTWRSSNMSMVSTRSEPPLRRKKANKQWHKQLSRQSLTSFKSQIGRVSAEEGKKRVVRKKSSNLLYKLKINDQLKKKARDFLCKFVDQYFNSKFAEDVPEEPEYPKDEVDPSPWYKRDQKIHERLAAVGVMEPVLEVEEEVSNEDRDSQTSSQSDRPSSLRKRPESPKKATWPEADLGCVQIQSGGTKVVTNKDNSEGTNVKNKKEPAIEGAEKNPKTETLTTKNENTLKANKSDTPKKNMSPQEATLDKQQENPRSKIRKSGAQPDKINAKPKVKPMTPSEPIITEACDEDSTTSPQPSKTSEETSKKMPISKSDISRRAAADPEKKQGTGFKNRKILLDSMNKSASYQGKTTELFPVRRNQSMVGKLKSHDRQSGDTISNITTISTELYSVDLGNLSQIHPVSVDGVSYNVRLPNDGYGRFTNTYFTGDSEKRTETLKRRLDEFWRIQQSKTELSEKSMKNPENKSVSCDVLRSKQKRKKLA